MLLGTHFIAHWYVLLLMTTASNAFSSSPQQRSTLTPRLTKAVADGLLVQPLPNLYILGTVHIGSESAIEAEELIELLKPDTVIVEASPSRQQVLEQRKNTDTLHKHPVKPKTTDPVSAILSWPAFADRGWSAGGFMGFVFASAILWPSFVKRSLSGNEEETELPRRDEFAATVQAAINLKDVTIVAADSELDELILDFSQTMSIGDWLQFGYREGIETNLGLRPKDPTRRRVNESIADWAKRRRTIETARASKIHGKEISSSFSNAVVDRRDTRFAQACLDALGKDAQQTIVCVVGLVHVDGICARL